MSNIRYMYVRDDRRNRVGVLVMRKRENGLDYQFSSLHPNDKFDRERGKLVAMEALNTNPIFISMTEGDLRSGHRISRTVMEHLVRNKRANKVPTRVVDFAISWLRFNKLNPPKPSN